mmetsp:Transcript_75525/g.121934  ORF Transcript_75525/g.121934 Transcript_75525/m.121934 type:complete len:160 (-) Transcript_75525:189-668(-)
MSKQFFSVSGSTCFTLDKAEDFEDFDENDFFFGSEVSDVQMHGHVSATSDLAEDRRRLQAPPAPVLRPARATWEVAPMPELPEAAAKMDEDQDQEESCVFNLESLFHSDSDVVGMDNEWSGSDCEDEEVFSLSPGLWQKLSGEPCEFAFGWGRSSLGCA